MANKSVRKDDSEPKYRIEFMYKEYDGEYTAEECGKNVEVMLKDTEPTRLYNPHFTFYRTDAGFTASTKKSQPAPKSFSEMVKSQRAKNKNIKKGVQISEGLEDELEKLYIHLDNAWNELAKAFDDVIDKSVYSELRKYADKCYDYYVAVGMLCSDVEDDMNWVKWRRDHPEHESDEWDQ